MTSHCALFLTSLGLGLSSLANAEKFTWLLHQTKTFEAWKLFNEREPGNGILIAQIDTGVLPHPELGPNVLIEQGYDFITQTPNPIDPLIATYPLHTPGHGTSTATYLVSPPGGSSLPNGEVWGITPGSQLIPYRVGSVPIFTDPTPLVKALRASIDAQVHVINISMGGVFSHEGEKLLAEAQSKGIIVVAAGGQFVPNIPWPASSPYVIAAAANDSKMHPWTFTTPGQKILISAPGKDVLVATSYKDNNNKIVYSYDKAEGTSFAAPMVAGAASLWLSYHGRQNLINKYGLEGMTQVFQHLLLTKAYQRPGKNWDSSLYGIGVIDVERLLKAPLPSAIPYPIGGVRSTPFEVAGLAYQGYLKPKNIPSGSTLCSHLSSTAVTAEQIVSAAEELGYIRDPDNAFVRYTETQLESLCRDSFSTPESY